MTKTKRFFTAILLAAIGCLAVFFTIGCGGAEAQGGFTVTFETDGGTTYLPVATSSPDQAVELAVPEKSGYSFLGWYEAADYSGERLPDTYIPTSDVTLYAKWQAISYTVTFETDGGTQYLPVTGAGRPVELPRPEKADYAFAGWYTTADRSGEPLDEGAAYIPAGDVTLYAKWAPLFAEVSFESNGGTEHDPMRVGHRETIDLPVPIRYGFEFLGWYDDAPCTGDALDLRFTSEADTVLYAKWQQVTYLYLYVNDSADHTRLSYAPGTTVRVADLDIPADKIVDGVACPFLKWCYDGITLTDVPETITLGEDHVCLTAVYDLTKLPPKEHVEENIDGSVTTTGKAIKVLIDVGENAGSYSVSVTFAKGKAGSANAAFRMTHSGADYAYEDAGTYYLAAGIAPSSGLLQLSKVVDGAWSTIRSNIPLTGLPETWQEKFNAAADGEALTVTLTAVDYGDRFEIYIDGALAYTCEDAALLETFTGTGLGLRSSVKDAIFSEWSRTALCTVRFDAQGGSACEDIIYGFGPLDAPVPQRSGFVFEGWYHDAACTQAVDLKQPVFAGGGL